jgi:type 1 glutamine amidotransferase
LERGNTVLQVEISPDVLIGKTQPREPLGDSTMIRSFVTALVISTATLLNAAEPVKVLLLDGQNNHNWKATTPIMVKALESTGRFKVEVSTSPAKGAAPAEWDKWHPKFKDYGVVLSNYNGQDWPEALRKDFETYVSGGGGFVCVHAADNAFPSWLEYNKMIGIGGWGGRNEKNGPYVYIVDGKVVFDPKAGGGGSHGPQHEFAIQHLDTQHPITRGLPATWMHAKDELYDSLRGPAENVNVLAYAHSAKSGRNEPMLMTLSYGKGRVFHTPMGHAEEAMRCAGFQVTLQRGTEWAATGAVTLPAPAAFPSADKVLPAP